MVGTGTSGHICFYADGSDCRPRRCERRTKWQQQTRVGRGRRSSGSVAVAGPEAHRLDKLALSRHCAMLMGSACPWKLEHVCVTFLGRSRYLDDVMEPFHLQNDRLWAYHLPGCKWKKEACCHDSCIPYRGREQRPISGRLGSCERPEVVLLAVEFYSA